MTQNKGTCLNCGAWFGLHRASDNLCPVNGIEETRPNKQQRWAKTVFKSIEPDEMMLMQKKAKKYDELEAIIVSCYPENEEDFDGDLATIGEKFATYFGYL